MRKLLNVVQHVVEYLLIAVYILAALGELVTQEPVTRGLLGALFSDPHVSIVYAVWFTLMSLALLASKIWRRKKLHKNTLAAMYLTTVYTITLSVALFGLADAQIIDDGIIGLAAAWCWLRWKLRTEYIDPAAFQKSVEKHRDDLPPS